MPSAPQVVSYKDRFVIKHSSGLFWAYSYSTKFVADEIATRLQEDHEICTQEQVKRDLETNFVKEAKHCFRSGRTTI